MLPDTFRLLLRFQQESEFQLGLTASLGNHEASASVETVRVAQYQNTNFLVL